MKHQRIFFRYGLFRRLPLLCILILFSCVSVFAGGSSEKRAERKSGGPLLRMGIFPTLSAIPIILAGDAGYFTDAGVDVEIVPFSSPNDRNVAFQAGKIDGFIGDIMTAVTFDNAGFPVLLASDINEDFKLLTSPESGIETFDDLDGGDVAFVPGFVLEYIMDEMARIEGIDYSTVVIPSFPGRIEALLTSQVDAVVFTEPAAAQLAARGAGVLAGTRDYGIAAGAMVFSRSAAEENNGAVDAFFSACNRIIEEINGTDLSEYSAVLTEYAFSEDISGEIDFSPARPVKRETFESVISWMKEKGTLTKDVSFEELTAGYQ